jgi:UDP-N-acetylmuramyl tripeptide synthase
MRFVLASIAGAAVSLISRWFGLGAGATWPGEIALKIDPHTLRHLTERVRGGVILVAGTNGKTTTTRMIRTVLESQHRRVLTNESGANLVNGLTSAFLAHPWSVAAAPDVAVFEVDENSLPAVLKQVRPKIVILLNLFRDQLDRYGEVDAIVRKWGEALSGTGTATRFIINADDPGLAYVGKSLKGPVDYFGFEDQSLYLPKMQHATDSIYCPVCGKKLTYGGTYYSHMGKWTCGACGFTHPEVALAAADVDSPLPGVYNIANTLAATLAGIRLGISGDAVAAALRTFTPAFGRMERLVADGVGLRVLLSKNPTGFNESLRTVLTGDERGPVLLVLNDRIPDGRDVSWIWDVDFEQLADGDYPVIISGDRVYDLAVRMRHALQREGTLAASPVRLTVEPSLPGAIAKLKSVVGDGQTGWILSTYSGMLDSRQILTGKKIL